MQLATLAHNDNFNIFLSDLAMLFQLRLIGVHDCGEWQVMYHSHWEGQIGLTLLMKLQYVLMCIKN